MTRGGPGYETSTTTTFMYLLKHSYIGESAAMSVVNFGLVILMVLLFLRFTRWKDAGDMTDLMTRWHRCARRAAPRPAGRSRQRL